MVTFVTFPNSFKLVYSFERQRRENIEWKKEEIVCVWNGTEKCNWKLSIESIGVGFVYLFLHKSHTCDYDSNKIVFAWIETSAFISIWVEPHWTWPMTWCYPLNITGNFILFMCSVHATAIYDLAFNSNACAIRILSAHCMSSRATPPMPTNTDIVRYVPLWHASVVCARANSQITSCA